MEEAGHEELLATPNEDNCSSDEQLHSGETVSSEGESDSQVTILIKHLALTDSNRKVKFHELCHICRKLCHESRILNNADLHRTNSARAFVKPGDPSYDLHASMSDQNQWNETCGLAFEEEFLHHLSGTALESSAAKGCHLCSLMWYHLSTERYGVLDQEINLETAKKAELSRIAARSAIKSSNEQLIVRVGIHHDQMGAVIVLYAGSSRILPQIRSTLNVWSTGLVSYTTGISITDPPSTCSCSSTSSDEILSLAKKWLHTCIEHHTQGYTKLCRGKDESWDPPSRVIDVFPQQPRLIFTNKEERNFRYLTLSHCWGGGDIFKLTQNTLSILKSGVDLGVLPRNFQDAIEITRRLGYQYLWIDSLCIFQDSREDWEQQSVGMSGIYEHSELNIAALGASNSHGGLFSSRDPLSYWPCKLSAGVDLTAWYGRVRPFHNERFTLAPLLRRAWVLQERCLGPRMLYFGKFGVYWECRCKRSDEASPEGFENDGLGPTGKGLSIGESMTKAIVGRRLYLVGQDHWGFPLYLKHSVEDPCPMFCFLKFLFYWYNIIEQYTRGGLTMASDKLIAISGLIELVQERTALTSFAGLWREFLVQDLLWSTVDPGNVSRPLEYRAPSFSWACLDGVVHRKFEHLHTPIGIHPDLTRDPHGYQKIVAAIISTNIIMADPTRSTGRVLSASVQIRGPVKKVKVKKLKETDYLGNSCWSHPYNAFSLRNRGRATCWLALDAVSDVSTDFLEITCMTLSEWSDGFWRHVAGLAVVPSPTQQSAYQRIGMFEDCWYTCGTRWKGKARTLTII